MHASALFVVMQRCDQVTHAATQFVVMQRCGQLTHAATQFVVMQRCDQVTHATENQHTGTVASSLRAVNLHSCA